MAQFQGSHSTWESWKNDESFSSHGNITEFLNFEKYHGKIENTPGKNENLSYYYCTVFKYDNTN